MAKRTLESEQAGTMEMLPLERIRQHQALSVCCQVEYETKEKEFKYQVDLAKFPPYKRYWRGMAFPPWNLSLYHIISLQLYYTSDTDRSLTDFTTQVNRCYKDAVSEFPPMYDGTTDVCEFLDQVELHAAIQEWTGSRGCMLRRLLYGAALEWYDNYLGHQQQLPWMDVRQCMQLAFPPEWSMKGQILQLEDRKQGPLEPVQSYIVSVLALCRQCDPQMDEDIMVIYIRVGLNAHCQSLNFRTDDNSSLHQLWDELIHLERSHPAYGDIGLRLPRAAVSLPSTSTVQLSQRYIEDALCPDCRSRGHISRYCVNRSHKRRLPIR